MGFSAVELGMRLGDCIWENRERRESLRAAYLVFWHALLVSRGFLRELGAGKKLQVGGGGSLERGDQWNPQKVGAEGQERLQRVFCCRDWGIGSGGTDNNKASNS